MVFYCRCFSFLLLEAEEEEIKYETPPTREVSNDTQYDSAYSNFSQSTPKAPSNPIVFTLAELEAATKDFCSASNIYEGEFWNVYKGAIKSLNYPFLETQVAVKRPRLPLQDDNELETELKVLGAVKHPNLVKLIGYCEEFANCPILVYEYMARGSLMHHLSARLRAPLSWNMRVKVAQDVARGLAYLHEELAVEIVLRDFKPSSVLFDARWNARLSDFGLARLHPQIRQNDYSTQERDRGNEKYIAPESIKEGIHTSKSDVWSYGVFLYDLITGTRPVAMKRNKPKLLKWANLYLGSKRFHQIVDPRLEGNYQLESVQKLCIIANKCLSKNPKSRPKMSEVLEMVNQLIMVPSQATSPASPQVLQVAVDPNNTIVGPTQGERNNKRACVPYIRPSKLLTSCCKKGCCVSLQ